MVNRITHAIRSFAGQRPHIFYPLYGLRTKNRRLFVTPETEIVIEGYPRCGNTFAVVAFEYAQKKPVSIAHHLHVPAQILRGVERGLPTLVLIRKPLDAIASLLVRHPHVDPAMCITDYRMFYELILPWKAKFVCADFEVIVNRYDEVIAKVNERFSTSFAPFPNGKDDVESVFHRIEEVNRAVDTGSVHQVARPAKEKEAPKGLAKTRLLMPQYAAGLQAANELYDRFVSECRCLV